MQESGAMTRFAARLLATALPLVILAAIVSGSTYALARRRSEARSGHACRVTIRALLATYAFALAWWTIILANPNEDGVRHANLIPFREITRSLTNHEAGYGVLNFWGNIVAFVPVGVLALLAIRRGRRLAWLIALASGTVLSAALEVAQYTVGRSADIDDVILNTVGVGLGVTLALAAVRGIRRANPTSHDETSVPPPVK